MVATRTNEIMEYSKYARNNAAFFKETVLFVVVQAHNIRENVNTLGIAPKIKIVRYQSGMRIKNIIISILKSERYISFS